MTKSHILQQKRHSASTMIGYCHPTVCPSVRLSVCKKMYCGYTTHPTAKVSKHVKRHCRSNTILQLSTPIPILYPLKLSTGGPTRCPVVTTTATSRHCTSSAQCPLTFDLASVRPPTSMMLAIRTGQHRGQNRAPDPHSSAASNRPQRQR